MSVEKTYKGITGFVNQSVNTALSVLKILFQSRFGVQMPKAEGERCIVLANGPSLKTSLEKHPEFFKKHSLICVNTFSVTKEYTELKPRYYVILDPFFWKGSTEVIQNTLIGIREKTNWPMYLLIPQHSVKSGVFNDLPKTNPNIQLVVFNYTVFKGFQSAAHYFYRKNLAMPQSPNVTIASLFLSANIGYKEIYLVGADHTWHENMHMSEDNVLHTKVNHFYENVTEVKFVPFLKEGDPAKGTQKAHEFFDMWSRTFYGYILVNRYASSQNCSIYNASETSFIDAFNRIRL